MYLRIDPLEATSLPDSAPARGDRSKAVAIVVSDMTEDDARWWTRNITRKLKADPKYRPGGATPRADVDWPWLKMLAFLPTLMRLRNQTAIALSVCVADVNGNAIPAAMLMLIERYPFVYDTRVDSVFDWFLTSAPPELLAPHTPDGVTPSLGRILLDISILHSRNRGQNGRIWLHAAPLGGVELLEFYGKCGMEQVPLSHSIPSVLSKKNDGRYFVYESPKAAAARQAFAMEEREGVQIP